MKVISATVLGLALLSGLTPALAQPYGGRDYGYDRRDYDGRDRDYDPVTGVATTGTMTGARAAGAATSRSMSASICAAIPTCAGLSWAAR